MTSQSDDEKQFTFTVFTPTYNRAHTLHRVYDSLCKQTMRDFEWLIVDDGSTDNTAEVVQQWIKEAWFPIRYIEQSNQGKHVAHNKAVGLARGVLFLPLDSDDACLPNALERLKHHWDSIPAGERTHFTGVTAACIDQDGRPVGSPFPFDVTDSDSLEIRFRYKVKGEKWGFHRTQVMRDFPFPEPDAGRFVPLDMVWKKIARHYKTRYVNEVLRIYFEDDADQVTRLSRNSMSPRAVPGRRLQNLQSLNNDLRWARYVPVEFLRTAGNYARTSFHCGVGVAEQWKALQPAFAKVLWLLMLPAGYAMFLRDRYRMRIREAGVVAG